MRVASNSLSVPARRAFTLVELLVVIAIIATLIGLLLPAVNSARESGRRTQCTNNQYQMAMAAIRHNDTNGFVPGWRNAMSSGGGVIYPSWPVVILPYMERKDVYTALTTGPLANVPAIPMYMCPSNPPDAGPQGVMMYSGNCGSGSNLLLRRYDGVMVDTAATGTAAFKLQMSDVSNADGTANTLLLSEQSGPNATLGTWLWVASTGTSFSWNAAPGSWNTPSWNTPPAPPGFGISGMPASPVINANEGSLGSLSQPSSPHTGGAVVAFCDGHTRFVSDTLDPAVYANLLNWRNTLSSAVGQAWVLRTQILDDSQY